MRSTSLKKYMTSIQKNPSSTQDDIYMKPDPTKVIGMRSGSYDKLNDRGYVPQEEVIVNGDIIIGKVTPLQESTGTGNKQFKDSSEVYKSHVSGVIDRVYTDIKNQDGLETRKVLVRSERTPKIGDKFCCFLSGHEILTNNGWKDVSQIKYGDEIACLENNKLMYKHPNMIMSYDCDEDIYYVQSNQVDLAVTKNHRMYVAGRNKKYKIEKAENIYGKRIYYKKNVDDGNNKTSPDGKFIDLEASGYKFILPATSESPALKVDLKAWLTFFGIWIAEGSMKSKTQVQIATHKQRVKDALEKCNKKLKININKYHENKNDTSGNSWVTTNKNIVHYITELNVGAINKKLPEWVWSLGKDHSRILIEGMLLGDGHTMENGTKRYDTSSKQLADDFQRLCLHAGWSTNITLKYKAGKVSVLKAKGREGETITSTVDSYRMTVIETQNEPIVNKNISTTDKSKQLDRYEHYKGKVYCCDVGGDGIIYVRRNGIPVWSGNSRHGQKGTCGIPLRAIDMPFTKHGMRPDIILNPNAIPSRMTMGQLTESMIGKVASLDGYDADGTPFEEIDMSVIENRLEELGYNRHGYEEMYNGMTGEKLKVQIFFGPTYYHRLKHLVDDKLHSRSRGPVQLLTHQPPEGKFNVMLILFEQHD